MFKLFKEKTALTVFGISALAASLICVALRVLGIIFFYDVDIGYFQVDAIVPTLLTVAVIVFIALFFIFTLVPPTSVRCAEPTENFYTRVISALVAVGFASFSVNYISSLIEYKNIYAELPTSYIACAVFSVLSCLFFLLKTFDSSKLSIPYVLCGIPTVLWFALVLAECYFNTFVQMNSPNKTVFLLACLSAILLIVNEMRVPLDRKRDSFHLFSAALASLLLSLSAIPSTVCYFLKKMPHNYTLISYDAVLLLMALFAMTRTAQLCFFACADKKDVAPTAQEDAEPLADEHATDLPNQEEAIYSEAITPDQKEKDDAPSDE